MPKRKKLQTAKRDWRWYMHTSLNVFVAISMVLGTVVLFTGGSFSSAAPTAVIPQDIPTLAPTVGAPTSAAPIATPTPVPSPTAQP